MKVKSFAGFARFTPKSTPIALRGHDDRYKTIGSNSHVSANWPIRTSRYRTIARINRVINRGRNSANVTHCKCDVRGRKHILRNEILQSRGAARGIGCAPLTLLPVWLIAGFRGKPRLWDRVCSQGYLQGYYTSDTHGHIMLTIVNAPSSDSESCGSLGYTHSRSTGSPSVIKDTSTSSVFVSRSHDLPPRHYVNLSLSLFFSAQVKQSDRVSQNRKMNRWRVGSWFTEYVQTGP